MPTTIDPFFTAQNARGTVQCTKCRKLGAKKNLSGRQHYCALALSKVGACW